MAALVPVGHIMTALAPSVAELVVLSAEFPMVRVMLAADRDVLRSVASPRHPGGSGSVLVAESGRELHARARAGASAQCAAPAAR